MTHEYPLMLYRHKPGFHVIWGVPCETCTVEDEHGLKLMQAKGFKLSPADADPKAILSEPDISEPDDRAALRAEYEKLAGKKPFGGWDAAKLVEKIEGLKS